MATELFNKITEQSKGLFAPIQSYNKMLVSNLEKVTELQLESIQKYRDLSIEQVKQLTDIENMDDAKDFSQQQMEVFNVISKHMLEDTQRLSDMGAEMQSNFQLLVSEVVDNVKNGSTEEPAAKKPAAKSTARKSEKA